MGSVQSLRIRCVFDENKHRQWQSRLVAEIAKRPHVELEVRYVKAANGLPAGAELLFDLERIVYGLGPATSSAADRPARLSSDSKLSGPVDLTIDFVADRPVLSSHCGSESERHWRLAYDGGAGETGLLASLMTGRAPVAEILQGDMVVASARLGTDHQGVLLLSFEDCLFRTITLVRKAIDDLAYPPGRSAFAPRHAAPTPAVVGSAAIARQAATTVTSGVIKRLYRLCFHSPHWRVGWRVVEGPDLFDMQRHPTSGWHDLADDGRRFYADPFAIVHKGRTILFVEDFVHRLGKGIISAVEFDARGPIGQPQPVLELPYHLSYPFVFERDGEVWMVPESCAAGTIDLFRATNFPSGWVKEATLVSDIVASDATLFCRDGRWWMFATVRDGGGAHSDALHLWSAQDFRGPWTAHRRNPVLIDIACARPAGHMVERNGVLWRPVQDCREGYGSALGFARINRLDDEGFCQKVETILQAGAEWPGRRIHTLNRAGGFEFVDGSAIASPRLARLQTKRGVRRALHAPAVVG